MICGDKEGRSRSRGIGVVIIGVIIVVVAVGRDGDGIFMLKRLHLGFALLLWSANEIDEGESHGEW